MRFLPTARVKLTVFYQTETPSGCQLRLCSDCRPSTLYVERGVGQLQSLAETVSDKHYLQQRFRGSRLAKPRCSPARNDALIFVPGTSSAAESACIVSENAWRTAR